MRREEQEPAAAPVDIEALADAVRGRGGAGREGEARALAAFRASRDAGTHARTRRRRRRDDWRPAVGFRRAGTRWRTALGSLVATTVLGGVAMAAGVVPVPFERRNDPGPAPTVDAPRSPGDNPAAVPAPGTTPERPPQPAPPSASARGPADPGLVGLCRARSAGNGVRNGQAFRRLTAAAGGEDAVDAFCARTLEESGTGGDPSTSGKPSKEPKATKSPKPSKSPKAPKNPKAPKTPKAAKSGKVTDAA
ncbi:hypothetical protein [Streptomyces clavifer]|uniref:hypothetical protein n=1 Tax=Streptomyces clavifer TaxID=68188 RepID=UPI0033A4F121